MDEPNSAHWGHGASIRPRRNLHFHSQSVLNVLDGGATFANDNAYLIVRHQHHQRVGGAVLRRLLGVGLQAHEDLHLRAVHGLLGVTTNTQCAHLWVVLIGCQGNLHVGSSAFLNALDGHAAAADDNAHLVVGHG